MDAVDKLWTDLVARCHYVQVICVNGITCVTMTLSTQRNKVRASSTKGLKEALFEAHEKLDDILFRDDEPRPQSRR